MINSIKISVILSLLISFSFSNNAHSQEEKSHIDLNIFPNPNRGDFDITVINNDSYQSQLHAMDGRLVKTLYLESGLNYISIDVPAGIYLLKVGEGVEQELFKITVK